MYRFRPPKQREIDAIIKPQIYLCRPRKYKDKDPEDCKWIDDLEALVRYDVTERSADRYNAYRDQFTDEKYHQIVTEMNQNPKYLSLREKASNMCLTSCITDKISNYMWSTYTENAKGICLEYNFADVLSVIGELGIRLFPIRYVENRDSTKDIVFGPKEYAENAPDELIRNKYILSCLTKNKVPYAKDSEWRVLCECPDIPETIDGKSFDFIRPSKIYLGKNIDSNIDFKNGILEVADSLHIPIIQL